MDCKLVRGHLDAYVDGEIEPSPMIEFEHHLDQCDGCRNELAMARLLQNGVQVLQAPAAPTELRRRVLGALDDAGGPDIKLRKSGVWTGALSGAAALALFVGAVARTDGGTSSAGQVAAMAEMPPFGMLGDIVARHTDELPADIAAQRPEQVNNWFRGKVGFRVQSVEFSEPNVQLLGARVSHIGEQPAVKLYYRMGATRLTSVVFQASPPMHHVLTDAQLAQRWGAHRERIGSRVVTYRNVHGYTVPLLEHDGVVYAFTGDLGQHQLLRLVASARLP